MPPLNLDQLGTPVGASPYSDDSGQAIPGYTNVHFDSGQSMTVPDPDGSLLANGQAVTSGMQQAVSSNVDNPPPGPMSPQGTMAQPAPAAAPPMEPSPVSSDDAFSGGSAPDAAAAQDFLQNARPAPGAGPAPAGSPQGSPLLRVDGGVISKTDTNSAHTHEALDPADYAALSARGKSVYDKQQAQIAAYRDSLGAIGKQRDDQFSQAYAANKAALDQQTQQRAIDQQAVKQANQELSSARAVQTDPNRLWGDTLFAVSAALGGLASDLLVLRRKASPESSAQYWQGIYKIVDADAKKQANDRQALIEAKTGVQLTADEAYKLTLADGLRLSSEKAKIMADHESDQNARLGMQLTANSLEQKADSTLTDLQQSIAGRHRDTITKNTVSQQVPAQVFSVPEVQLRQAGVTPDEYQKASNAKVKEGQTASQAGAYIQQLDQDTATLDAIAKENGGTLPTKGVIDFNRSDKIRTLGARLGFKGQMTADEVNQLLKGRAMERARSYGGVVTKSDVENAETEMGATTESIQRFMKRERDRTNQNMQATLRGFVPGKEQIVTDIMTKPAGPGVRNAGLEGF